MPPIRIGVIGLGYWGTKVVGEYLDLSRREVGVELVKVCDMNPDVLRSCAIKFQIPEDRLSNNPAEIMESSEIDAIHIATPNPTHFPLCKEALQRGKHVLVEKPMALTSRDAFRLARLAEEENLILQVGHIFRFNNALRKAKQLIGSGVIGEIFYCDISWAIYQPFPDRGIIFDLAAHPVDILNFLLDEWPISVDVLGSNFVNKEKDNEDTAFAFAEFPDGVLARLFMTWVQHGQKTRTVTVVGSKGTLVVDALNQKIVSYGTDDRPEDIIVEVNNTIGDMVSHFGHCIESGQASANSALVGALVVRSLEAMKESLRKKGRIAIVPN
jgi:predicted dehydrogenase